MNNPVRCKKNWLTIKIPSDTQCEILYFLLPIELGISLRIDKSMYRHIKKVMRIIYISLCFTYKVNLKHIKLTCPIYSKELHSLVEFIQCKKIILAGGFCLGTNLSTNQVDIIYVDEKPFLTKNKYTISESSPMIHNRHDFQLIRDISNNVYAISSSSQASDHLSGYGTIEKLNHITKKRTLLNQQIPILELKYISSVIFDDTIIISGGTYFNNNTPRLI
jgi:hypothetical protein